MSYFQTRYKKEKRWICVCKRVNDATDEKCAFCGETKPSDKKHCNECGQEFMSRSHGGKKIFCSNRCAAKNQWKTRERNIRNLPSKKCLHCGKQFMMNGKMSSIQWSSAKYCSWSCSAANKKIHDGMNNGERGRRKMGRLKKGTPECLQKISARTKEGMMRPDVIEKLQRPKGPMSLERRIIQSNNRCKNLLTSKKICSLC